MHHCGVLNEEKSHKGEFCARSSLDRQEQDGRTTKSAINQRFARESPMTNHLRLRTRINCYLALLTAKQFRIFMTFRFAAYYAIRTTTALLRESWGAFARDGMFPSRNFAREFKRAPIRETSFRGWNRARDAEERYSSPRGNISDASPTRYAALLNAKSFHFRIVFTKIRNYDK